jgi:hypothetical protein
MSRAPTHAASLACAADDRSRALVALGLGLGWEDCAVPREVYFGVVAELERAERLSSVLGKRS